MNIAAYLDRIQYTGPLTPSFETLRALHRAHLLAIPYENLDIHLGRELALDEQRMFEKIVVERRGGWCYEMNGLFAWALRELGFNVRLLSSAVNRQAVGSLAEGNHLILLAELDQPYLADVGFGNGFLEPLPLQPGKYRQGFFTYELTQDGERWWFRNHEWGGPGFDFTLSPRALADFAAPCHYLQTSPDSGFVRVAVCHTFMPEGIVSLRGAVLTSITEAGVQTRTIDEPEMYTSILRETFGLDLPEASVLWEHVWQSHLAWVQSQAYL